MPQKTNNKQYDLEGRTLVFTKRIYKYVNSLPKNTSNIESGKQLVRSGGSIGANYIEANESLSKKDFVMRVKISKKEAKESIYWLNLTEPSLEWLNERNLLIQETTELMKILGSILVKSE